MGPGEAVSSVFHQYAKFDGRASRSEYWWYALALIVGSWAVLFILAALSRDSGPALAVFSVAWLLLIIPTLAVWVRRLHDVGRSGWWWLIGFIPFGGLVLLVFTLLDSEAGPNRWGPPPPGSRYADPSTWRYGYAGQMNQGGGWNQTPPAAQPGWGPPQQPTWPPAQPAPSWQQPTPPPQTWSQQPAPPTQPAPSWQQPPVPGPAAPPPAASWQSAPV